MAFEIVKAMQAEGLEWGEGYRPLGRWRRSSKIKWRQRSTAISTIEADDTLRISQLSLGKDG
jgi:hypothetical protein